ncbi:hypothetical protein CPJCM30710_31490 [Clostridium polyendosporum]|uniref:Uncharacterized protein n=1 Tax=Clostridium polyendosporum TaxID=69208 RepID=A0A919VNF1_9CLOT|nr:hypothetical protein [Clostridium polyendosporum]GIM30483.1 hypothetical protein CPJCM30710_31490 [Clostridium polyendosporum]
MEKKLKSSTDNQWASVPEELSTESGSANKKPKTATDNQWTTTAKNNISEK